METDSLSVVRTWLELFDRLYVNAEPRPDKVSNREFLAGRRADAEKLELLGGPVIQTMAAESINTVAIRSLMSKVRTDNDGRAVFPRAKDGVAFDVFFVVQDMEQRLAAATVPPESGDSAANEGVPKVKGSKSPPNIELFFGDDIGEVVKIARSQKSSDEKMRLICAIDRRYLAWDSPEWSDAIAVSDAAIRQTPFWKVDRPKLMG